MGGGGGGSNEGVGEGFGVEHNDQPVVDVIFPGPVYPLLVFLNNIFCFSFWMMLKCLTGQGGREPTTGRLSYYFLSKRFSSIL